MSDNNPIVPFQRPEIPIIGQPCSMNGGFVTLSITCNCEAKQSLLIVGFGTLTTCQACGRTFRMLAYAHDLRTGEPPKIHLDIVMAAGPSGAKPS